MRPLAAFLSALFLPSLAFGQTYYKCRTASGTIAYSDAPCPGGTRQEQVLGDNARPSQDAPQAQYAAPQKDANARLLDAKVAEALGSGDFPRAKGLAVTAEHWRMIAEAEQRQGGGLTGRTSADLRAELQNSTRCREAQRSYEVEASSIKNDRAMINATKRRMYAACGMDEPTVIENRTIINDNRPTHMIR
ncbi:MAG: hypothetical protein AW08_00805 [Candidatus Accumulibacter adjunctus]|uniref:DUF4124 domain-containing protein n=1 Tax=Candidatus Accumulibacter adjunctus TaxID=1454001 RepID=A0A011PRN5_9PROT|nr:MAG: hypothetical protein AW08_00805 [Candidatus Accumulibacter adjunctus]